MSETAVYERVRPTTIHIEVTDIDILSGIQGDPNNCPIANAIKRQVIGFDPCVDSAELRLYDDLGHEFSGPLPQAAKRFIRAYDMLDETGDVEDFGEFSFDIDVWLQGS